MVYQKNCLVFYIINLTIIYPISSAILCSLIEYIRIYVSVGRVHNINKVVTWTIGAVFFGVCMALSFDYYDNVSIIQVIVYGIYYSAVRGVLYDIVLNVLRGLDVSYTSKTTNSRLDKLFNPLVSFWGIRSIYAIISIISGVCYHFLYIQQ